LFARDFRVTVCTSYYEERTLGALLSLFGLIYSPVKEEEIVFARALRGLAATFLRFAPIVYPRGMSAANFRPHLKACSRERRQSLPLLSFFFSQDALDRGRVAHSRWNCIVKRHLTRSYISLDCRSITHQLRLTKKYYLGFSVYQELCSEISSECPRFYYSPDVK